MPTEQERFFRRMTSSFADKYHLHDRAMEEELYEMLIKARAWQPSVPVAQDKRNHPAVKAVESVIGHSAPREMLEEIIELVGSAPDITDLERARRDWIRAGRDPNAWVWLKWTNSQRKARPAGAQKQKADPFAGIAGAIGD